MRTKRNHYAIGRATGSYGSSARSTAWLSGSADGAKRLKTLGDTMEDRGPDVPQAPPVVISDTEAVYLYGLDILAQQQSERLYYVYDGLGSLRQLLDSTGDVESNYAYDPFGVPVLAGDASNPYQFTGEAWDAEVGLLYLRARYYQPATARFITKDPWMGDIQQPNTLNRYAYVASNAVNRTDPTGLWGPGSFPKPPLPEPGHVREVAGTFQIAPELLGALLQTVVDIDYNFDDFLVDAAVQLLVIKRIWGSPETQLLAEFVLDALPESVSTGLAQMQYGTARGVEDWLAQRIAQEPADCDYLQMLEPLPETQNRLQRSFQLLRRDQATVYAAAHLRQIAEHRFGRRVSVVALRDEQMALVASLYNAGMYSPIRHYSENKFGNYIMKNDLLGAWRRKLGIAPRYQLDLGRP